MPEFASSSSFAMWLIWDPGAHGSAKVGGRREAARSAARTRGAETAARSAALTLEEPVSSVQHLAVEVLLADTVEVAGSE